MSINDVTLTTEPLWPWSGSPGVGGLLLLGALLAGLTVWTYLGVTGATPRRVLTVVLLRLAALVLAVLSLLRPSLASRDDVRVPSLLILAADASQSMSIQDEVGGQARWGLLQRLLKKVEPQLERLREERGVSVAFHRFGADVGDYDPDGKPDGKRTDFGVALRELLDRHRGERHLRGLIVLSDGADNGTRYPALAEAAKWRSHPCPIHAVALGRPTTGDQQSDVAILNIVPEPSPVPVKGELTVKLTVDAPGFENAPVNLRLLLDDKELPVTQVSINDQKIGPNDRPRLPLTSANDVRLKATAPAEAKEVKLTVKIEPLPGEVSAANNEISTYLTIAKEGLSVLVVDKPRFPEPQFLIDALRLDPRVRVYTAWLRRGEAGGGDDLYQFGRQHYDVVILGDVTAKALVAGDPKAMTTLNTLVRDQAAGLLLMGGYGTFADGGWRGTEVARMLPIDLEAAGQVPGAVKMVPTEEGLRSYILRLADRREDSATVWEKLKELRGSTRLGGPKPGATLFARSAGGEPLLVGHAYGKGRVLTFGGDSTFLWRTTPEGVAHHTRFWKQMVFWLAHQEESKGSVVIKPDARRLPAGGRLGFAVDLRGKNSTEPKEKHFEVKVAGPAGQPLPVETARDREEERGTFWKTDTAGEYRLIVKGWGKDADGAEIAPETAEARFLVYQDDAELMRRAADHEFLRRVAAAGGGRFLLPDELEKFLADLEGQPLPQGRAKPDLLPDWRPNRASGFLWGFYLVFVLLLSVEWFLRRRWGLV